MSKVINPESAGKERARLTKAIVLAVRQLAHQTEISAETRDLAAFIVLALAEISKGVEVSALAWEKRNYWLKADRFRMDWAWCGTLGARMKQAILADDWTQVAQLAIQIAGKLSGVKLAENHRLGKPWTGAYARLLSQKN